MRRWQMPRLSFRSRLLAAALLWIGVGISTSWLVLSAMLHEDLVAEFADELDHHAGELAELAMLDASGRPALRQALSDNRFFPPNSGHYWQIAAADGATLASPSLGEFRLDLSGAGEPGGVLFVQGPTGEMMLLQRTARVGPKQAVLQVAVGIDHRLIDVSFARFRTTLGRGLAVIAAGLVLAVAAQVSFGLQPLHRLRRALAAIRRGEADALPGDLPVEVAPLVDNMNALLRANLDVVHRARVQAGNLAHALKGPLAILLDEGRRLEAAGLPGGTVVAQCERMQRQIEYHLARARAAGASLVPGAVVQVGPALENLVSAVARLYRDRGLAFDLQGIAAAPVAACEAEDFDEMLGNLIENAAKWATHRVQVNVVDEATGMLHFAIEDDGPGLPPEAADLVFEPGKRLDEQVPGSGLGLAIVRDIAQLYGGRVWLDRSSRGGLAAHLALPAIVAPVVPRHAMGT